MQTGLAKYDQMIHAIAECKRSDEAKKIRDQARALEVLSFQAKNIEAEKQAAEIRIRAERRWGQMYRQAEKSRGVRLEGTRRSYDTTTGTLDDLGVSKDQSSQWQKLADISDKQFESILNKVGVNGVVTTSGVLRAGGKTVDNNQKESNPDADAALWVWGRVNQMAETFQTITAKKCWNFSDEVMKQGLRDNLPKVIDWLEKLEEEMEDE